MFSSCVVEISLCIQDKDLIGKKQKGLIAERMPQEIFLIFDGVHHHSLLSRHPQSPPDLDSVAGLRLAIEAMGAEDNWSVQRGR